MNKRQSKKRLRSNREELRKNLLKLEEVTTYLQKNGVQYFSKYRDDWEFNLTPESIDAFSKKFEMPQNLLDWNDAGNLRTNIMMNGFRFYSFKGDSNGL